MKRALAICIAIAFAAAPAAAQEQPSPAAAAWESSYELPTESVQRLFEVDKNYATLDNRSPDGQRFLIPVYEELSTVARMGEPTQRLAGLELRGQRNRTWRLDTFGIVGLRIFDMAQRTTTDAALPEGSLVSDMTWSPDGTRLAVLVHGREQTEVWLVDAASGAADRLSPEPVMATLATRSQGRTARQSSMVQWTSDGGVITLLVPQDRGPQPTRGLARGPVVRRTREQARPNPTYPFLLDDDHEERLFRYHTTAQIAELRAGAAPRPIGDPGMIQSLSLSPDGRHLLVERITGPLSPLVTHRSFARTLEVRRVDGGGSVTLRQRPLLEGRSAGGGPDRDLPREVSWLPDGSGLGFLQVEPAEPAENGPEPDDDGQPEDDDSRLDRILTLAPPFTIDEATTLASSENRLSGLLFSADGRTAFVHQARDGKRALVAYRAGSEPATLLEDWEPSDPLQDPGDLMRRATGNGVSHALGTSEAVFLAGAGYREDLRPRPFVDRVLLDGSGIDRVFESSAEMHERPLLALDDTAGRMIVERQSTSSFPDSWLWSADTGFVESLTANQDPFPSITAARRIDFSFTRRDGLEINARISMPVGWTEGERVPAIFWTYPREHDSERDYRRATVRGRNNNAFTHLSYLRWSDIWLSQGYALVYPDVPIIGDPYNDQFIQDLSDTLYAAIRKVDQMGWVDIDRIGHGGHSYGAFATANLLANTPYFKAGIAGDGAYNRTLTPMGFQSERRYIWSAEDTYLEMSPFFRADHIDTPLLMYHGGDDNNTGTYPIQSRRMIQALQGLGKTAVLYEYPYESHGPSAIESYLDLWKRWLDWFDHYVKHAAGSTE